MYYMVHFFCIDVNKFPFSIIRRDWRSDHLDHSICSWMRKKLSESSDDLNNRLVISICSKSGL